MFLLFIRGSISDWTCSDILKYLVSFCLIKILKTALELCKLGDKEIQLPPILKNTNKRSDYSDARYFGEL